MSEIIWHTANNLKLMLQQGKTFLEIKSKNNREEVVYERTKNIIEDFIKSVSAAEIEYCIEEMEPADQENYQKIVDNLMKRFDNHMVVVTLTVPESTIVKFHKEFEFETKGTNGLWIIIICGLILLITYLLYTSKIWNTWT